MDQSWNNSFFNLDSSLILESLLPAAFHIHSNGCSITVHIMLCAVTCCKELLIDDVIVQAFLQPLDQTLMQLLPVFTKSCSQHSISPGYWTTVGLPNIPPQLLQPMMLKHIQDKSLQVDHTLLATLPTHPESLQQQQQVLLSCMQWFHHTLQTAMSNSATTVNSATVSSPDMLPYIRLISKRPRILLLCVCSSLLQLCTVLALSAETTIESMTALHMQQDERMA